MRTILLIVWIAGCRISDRPFTGLAQPRLIAPTSLSTVTQQRPTLRWELGPGGGVPAVELCKDLACTMTLPIATQIAGDGLSAVPVAALPTGWVYWRVRVAEQRPTGPEPETVTSATWPFWVGTSASTPVDTSQAHRVVFDVNGDGYPDFLVGSSRDTKPRSVGIVHLYLGSATPDPAGWNGAAAPRRIDVETPYPDGSSFGTSMASVGDVNGDGHADFLVGDDGLDVAHLYLGSAAPSAAEWMASSSPLRIDIFSPAEFLFFGGAVASAGDVNGDGYGDFLVGAYDDNGVVYLYLGGPDVTPATWNEDSPARIKLAAADATTRGFGYAVASAGDVNRDGFADFVVATYGDTQRGRRGGAHLYLGAATPSTAWEGSSPSRIDLRVESTGILVDSVSGAGDVNGDGYADFVVSTIDQGKREAAAHLYLGSAAVSAASWNDTSTTQRIALSPLGTSGEEGCRTAGAGDVNGDGYADFAIGVVDSEAVSKANLYLGAASPDAATWNEPAASRRIVVVDPANGSSLFGFSIASAGDINADGYAEFVVGTPEGVVAEGVHVYFGSAAPSGTAWNGPAAAGRIDLVNPDDTQSRFGKSLARAEPRIFRR